MTEIIFFSLSHFRTIFPGSALEPLHPPPPLLLPLEDDCVPLHNDRAPLLRVVTKDEICGPGPDLGTPALVILLPDPELQGPALLHVPHLAAPPERCVEARLELEPLAVVPDLLADVDQQDVVLAAVLPHVDLPGGLGALAAARPRVVLGVGAVVAAPATGGAAVRGVAAVGLAPAPRLHRRQARAGHLDAGRDGGARLLVALGAPVTLLARDPVLAGALPIGLVADLAARPHGVTVAGSARLLVSHRLVGVPEVSLLAVVAVSARGVVTALVAHAPAHSAAESEQLHVEAAPPGVQVAVARLALVGLDLGGAAPRSVKVEWFALLTLAARRVVLTVAGELPVLVPVTSAGVTIALASASNGQV